MADRILENIGELAGSYAGTPFTDSKSSELTVTLADVPFTKEADQSIWFGGPLTVTFTINNTTGAGPLENLILTDTLDETKFAYIANSDEIIITDGTTPRTLVRGTDYTIAYAPDTPDADHGLLTVTFIGNNSIIAVGERGTVSFQGNKVAA